MEYRRLGRSGLRVSALAFGTITFGGANEYFRAWGSTDVAEAARLIDICLDHGLNLLDCADVYSNGAAEEIVGQVIKGRRDQLLLSTKAVLPMGVGPNDYGASRHHLIAAVDGALKRLGTDYIDLFQLHAWDGLCPVEETLATLDSLVRAGKIRYIGCSNYSGWQVMKSVAASDARGYSRFVANQAYYSLLNRDYEWELMPVGLDQGIGGIIWSPLGWGKLTGKIRRDRPPEPGSRAHDISGTGPQYPEERLFAIVDTLIDIADQLDKTVPQVALNWLLRRPSVSSVIIGARNEAQLVENLGAVGWSLPPELAARLDKVSDAPAPYPVWYQRDMPMLMCDPN